MWFEKYVSVGERAAKARKKISQLRKKNHKINPVSIEGNQIATSWWGKAWVNHIKHYADFDNRIGRGRSYVKNGLVIHLAIKSGYVEAMVMGTRSQPYNIKIEIKKISQSKQNRIKRLSQKHLYTLSELVEGRLPKELEQIFSDQKEGIFPTLKEMSFHCSCPDWAEVCKHVSASLFALGARLDDNIDLFFKLRGLQVDQLVQSALKKEVTHLKTKKAQSKTRVLKLSEKNLASLFDIKLVTPKSSAKKPLGKKVNRQGSPHFQGKTSAIHAKRVPRSH